MKNPDERIPETDVFIQPVHHLRLKIAAEPPLPGKIFQIGLFFRLVKTLEGLFF
jgi:hypothetical protein